MKLSKLLTVATVILTTVAITSCTQKKFHISGNITEAGDSLLYFENMSLDGQVTVDSVKLGKDGSFDFSEKAPKHPEFYRLRIARQIINIAIDSTETISVKASYPTMSSQYDVQGSEECSKIKELATLQMNLQAQVNGIVGNPGINGNMESDSIMTVLNVYKDNVKRNYIFKEPMKAFSYFALFQTISVGNQVALIFDPRSNNEDVKVFAAVATSWDTYFPGSERGKNLHNIAIEGMKNVRIIQSKQAQTIDAAKVTTSGVIDIALPDNNGNIQRLTDLKGKVVMLDFHVFATKSSTVRIMQLRELYNKYHAQGFEIYQVSLDPDEHFWKESVSALPWVRVRDANGMASTFAAQYNVQAVPTFFLIDKNNVLQKRDVQIQDLDAEIKSML
ncbi:MAG: TlpA disulfide reductase family protein [Prevotella sp.]|nr:TlpA disulfide reductase family protein [Prevotella sp.]MDD4532913.1 TlpA disulfide reductase family protein [Prevotella sp.]MDT3386329.1 AhpC/TSA family protein [Bacteroidota bacterium]